MSDLIQVLISAKLDEATKKQLQAELDQLAKKASGALGKTGNSSGTTKAIKAQADSMSLLKARYDAGKISAEQFLAYSNKIVSSARFQTRSIQDQAKAIKIRTQVEKEYSGAAEKTISVQKRLSTESKRELDNKLKAITANQKAIDQQRKYIANQQQLMSGQQGSLINRLQGSVVGKTSVLTGSPELSNTYKTLEADISKFGQSGSKTYKQLSNDLGKFNNSLRQQAMNFKNNNHDGYTMIEMLGVAARKYAIWMATTTATMQALRAIRDGIKYVVDLDNALNDVRIVTGYSQEQVEALADSYGRLAKEMSVTTLEIAKQSAELFRQGLANQDVEERMKGIITYAKISGLSIDESGKIITATMNATGRSISDVINIFAYLGDMTAAGADEIGQALQGVASSADIAGLSLERVSAYIATISSITRQSASTIGRSLNSVLSRYQSIKEKGFNEEDATNLNQVTKALNAVGITAVDSSGQLRNFGDVLDELGPKFEKLDTNQRNYIATTLFGTFQMNRGVTLLSNYGVAMDNYEMAMNSAGSAQEKFNVYQESTQAHLDRMTASWQNVGKALIDSNLIKTIIDIGAGFADALPVILSVTAAIIGFFLAAKLGVASVGIQAFLAKVIVSLTGTATAAMGASIAFSALAGVGIMAAVVALGMVIKLASDAYQKNLELERSIKNVTDAYKEYAKNPNSESITNYRNAIEQRIALLQQETESLEKEKEKQETLFKRPTGAYNPLHNAGISIAYNEQEIARLQEAQMDLIEAQELGRRTNETERDSRKETIEVVKEQVKTEEELIKAKEDATEAYDKATASVNGYQSKLSSLASQYDSINKGENISKENLLQLLADYPEYTDQIVKNVGTKEGELKLTNILFNAVKEKYIMEQQMAIEAAKSVAVLNNANIDGLRLTERYLRTMMANSDLPSTTVDNLRTQLKQIDELMYGSKTMAEIKARQSAIFAMRGVTASDFNYDASGKTKTSNSLEDVKQDQIKSAQEAQSTITSIIESEVDKRKKAIEDQYDAEIDAIQEVMDLNDKRWAEEDYEKSIDDQMDMLKKLNDEKAKYTASALSGDLTAQKKIREIDEDIAKEKEKLTDTQVDRQRTLQKEALDDKKTALETEKKLELEKLETVFDKSKVTATALQALFASNLDGFNSILTTYLKNLGIAESEIKKIIGGVSNEFGRASAGVGVAKKAGVSAGEFSSYAEGGKSPMQVAMENSSYGQKIGAKGIENDLKTLLSLQASWAGASNKQAVNEQANAIRKKYGITDSVGSVYPAWAYAGSYAVGGKVTTTGIGMLHGSPARPEYVLNDYQANQAVMGNFNNTPLKEVARNTTNNNGFNVGSLITIEGNVDRTVIPEIKKIAKEVMGEMQWMFNKSGQTRFA